MGNLRSISNKYPNSFKLLAILTLVVTMPLLVGALLQSQTIKQNAQVIIPSPTMPVIISTPIPINSPTPSQPPKSPVQK